MGGFADWEDLASSGKESRIMTLTRVEGRAPRVWLPSDGLPVLAARSEGELGELWQATRDRGSRAQHGRVVAEIRRRVEDAPGAWPGLERRLRAVEEVR
jgi:hypothetical protein